jgi:hypothetical protein
MKGNQVTKEHKMAFLPGKITSPACRNKEFENATF